MSPFAIYRLAGKLPATSRKLMKSGQAPSATPEPLADYSPSWALRSASSNAVTISIELSTR